MTKNIPIDAALHEAFKSYCKAEGREMKGTLEILISDRIEGKLQKLINELMTDNVKAKILLADYFNKNLGLSITMSYKLAKILEEEKKREIEETKHEDVEMKNKLLDMLVIAIDKEDVGAIKEAVELIHNYKE